MFIFSQFTWIWETSQRTQQLWHSLLQRPAQQDYGKLKYHKLVAATLTGSPWFDFQGPISKSQLGALSVKVEHDF
jgi:hypothetical protein